jgi:hypothetical protein
MANNPVQVLIAILFDLDIERKGVEVRSVLSQTNVIGNVKSAAHVIAIGLAESSHLVSHKVLPVAHSLDKCPSISLAEISIEGGINADG